MSAAPRPRSSSRHRTGRGIAAAVLGVGLFIAAPAARAAADTCDPTNTDSCVVLPTVTPLGPVTVTVTSGNVVTVHLQPTSPNTLVFGVPFSYPPGPPVLPGYTRTSIPSTGGEVTIDTIQFPPGPPTRPARPSLAVISIHPPSPCRAVTTGSSVVFTPVIPPGPPV
jgi:hypothetical protein